MKLFSFAFIAVGFAGFAFEGLSIWSAMATLSTPATQVVCGAVFLMLASSLKKKSPSSAVAARSSTANARHAFQISASEARQIAG
jgi:hypothetical protein